VHAPITSLTSMMAPYWSHTAKLLVVTSCTHSTAHSTISSAQALEGCYNTLRHIVGNQCTVNGLGIIEAFTE
jgi:hypothetical protein